MNPQQLFNVFSPFHLVSDFCWGVVQGHVHASKQFGKFPSDHDSPLSYFLYLRYVSFVHFVFHTVTQMCLSMSGFFSVTFVEFIQWLCAVVGCSCTLQFSPLFLFCYWRVAHHFTFRDTGVQQIVWPSKVAQWEWYPAQIAPLDIRPVLIAFHQAAFPNSYFKFFLVVLLYIPITFSLYRMETWLATWAEMR